MIGLLKKMFSNSSSETPVEDAVSPGGTIRYDSTLIEGLRGEHASLVALFQQAGQAFKQADYITMRKKLLDFKSELQQHLMRENVKFYVYIEQLYASDDATSEVIQEFRHEMNTIAKVVTQFLRTYTQSDFTPSLAASFENDYNQIWQALSKRIEREETQLYVMYSTPDKVTEPV